MKPFNLEEAKAGKPVCTKCGFPVDIICFDTTNERWPIIALIHDAYKRPEPNGEPKKHACLFTKEGTISTEGENNPYTLMMVDGNPNPKPFNLEEAMAGKPVCTRTGYPVRILCYDRKRCEHPIVALWDSLDVYGEYVETYTKEGKIYSTEGMISPNDLIMI